MELDGVWERLQCEQRLAYVCVEGLEPLEEALAGDWVGWNKVSRKHWGGAKGVSKANRE